MTEQPWLQRPDWAARTIPNVNRGSISVAVFLWVFALLWNGFLAAMTLVMRSTNAGPPPKVLYAALSPFVLAGLFLLGLAITITVKLVRYRSLVLRLDTLPGVVGGRLAGTIHGAEGVLSEGMSLRLECWRRYSSHSKKSDDLVWEDVEDIPRGTMFRSPAGATVPFRFDVPWECKPTRSDDRRIEWVVTIQTDGGGAAASFDVPVYRTEQSSPDVNEMSLRPRNVAKPPYSKLRFQREPDGSVEIRFPSPTWLWKWWVFTIVVATAAIVVAREQLPALVADGMPHSWVVGTYAAIAAVVLFLVGIIQLGLLFSPRLLRVRREELRMRFQSLFRDPRVVPTSDIADVVAELSNSTRKYAVNIQRTGGKIDPWLMITAADKREAEWLAHELRVSVRTACDFGMRDSA